jgi:hypothetical protein
MGDANTELILLNEVWLTAHFGEITAALVNV